MNISKSGNFECVSLLDVLEQLGVLKGKKTGVEVLKNYLRELTPNRIYTDIVSSSDKLTDEMIVTAAGYESDCIFKNVCSTKCPKSNSFFNCFIIDAAIKYDSIRKANDYSEFEQLTTDCFYSADEDEKLYYIRGNFYDYIYYIITHNKRNGRGTGARSDHFMSRFQSMVFPDKCNSEDDFLSDDFIQLFDNFIEKYNINIDETLINSIVTAFPEACKLAVESFPLKNMTGRELIAVLIAESISGSVNINVMINSRKSQAEEERINVLEDKDTKARISAIFKRIKFRYNLLTFFNVLLTIITIALCVLSLFFYKRDLMPDLSMMYGSYPYFLLLQAIIFPVNFRVGLKRRTLWLYLDRSRNSAFSEYIVKNASQKINLPGLDHITSNFTYPYYLEFKTSRLLIFLFTGIIALIIFTLSMIYSSIYLLASIMPLFIIGLTITDSVIETKTLFASFDRLANLSSKSSDIATSVNGKYKFFNYHTDTFDGIYSDVNSGMSGIPGKAIRNIYFFAYQTRKENSATLIFLVSAANSFCFLSSLIIEDPSMAMITTLLTLALTLFYHIPGIKHNYISRLLFFKYKAVFHPSQKLGDTLSRDIKKKILYNSDICIGKKAFLRSLIYELGSTPTDKPINIDTSIPEASRLSYASYFRYTQGRKALCSFMLICYACTSFFLLIGNEMMAVVFIVLCLLFLIAVKLDAFEFIFPIPPAKHFEKKLQNYLDKKADQPSD